MSDPDQLGGLFGLGQRYLRDEDEGLRDLCRDYLIDPSGPEAWRMLALVIARKNVPGFPYQNQLKNQLKNQLLVEALKFKGKSSAGRKPRPQKTKERLLAYVEYWKRTQQRPSGPKRTDREALRSLLGDNELLQYLFPDVAKDGWPQLRRLMNIVSRTRKEQKHNALVEALKRHSRK